jgi:uncharacterized membrane protein YeaQ/YmgE (transglycosylase-associated protein family)
LNAKRGWKNSMDPTLTFIVVLVIGIAAGIIAQRVARPSWLTRQIAGGRRADVTSALVGIAGAFIGFHLVALLLLASGLGVLFLGAAAGAILVLWGWREIKL